jgi:hypothetical protein
MTFKRVAAFLLAFAAIGHLGQAAGAAHTVRGEGTGRFAFLFLVGDALLEHSNAIYCTMTIPFLFSFFIARMVTRFMVISATSLLGIVI